MIEQYEKEYQEAKAEYEQLSNPAYTDNMTAIMVKEVKDKYWKAYHNLNDAKSAENFNKREHRFW